MNGQLTFTGLLGTLAAGTAHAAEMSPEGAWGIAVRVFAGYCLLVVVPQLFRVILLLLRSYRKPARTFTTRNAEGC